MEPGFSVYDHTTGMIICRFAAIESAVSSAYGPNALIIAGQWRDSLFYVVDHKATPRPTIDGPSKTEIEADDDDLVFFTGIPEGTVVTVTGPVFSIDIVNDGTFEWSTAHAGTYGFVFTPPWPCRKLECTVTANA